MIRRPKRRSLRATVARGLLGGTSVWAFLGAWIVYFG